MTIINTIMCLGLIAFTIYYTYLIKKTLTKTLQLVEDIIKVQKNNYEATINDIGVMQKNMLVLEKSMKLILRK